MAFNPFHGFRKHAKIYFAILTIVCMVTFVLCSGIGGRETCFELLLRRLGCGKAPQGETLIVGGQRIIPDDLIKLRLQREMASQTFFAGMQSGLDLRNPGGLPKSHRADFRSPL